MAKSKKVSSYRTEALRPMRDLLRNLPVLPTTPGKEIDFAAADQATLYAIAEDAETVMAATYMGLGAIGTLLANSAVVIEDGTISADCVEALGWFQTEVAEMAHHFMVLAVKCRQHTTDFDPPPRVPLNRLEASGKNWAEVCK